MNPSWRYCPDPHPLISAIPAFSDNYIWLLRSPDGRSAAVVDPGDAAPVEAALDRAGLRLCAIVLTHHHADHVGGVGRLKSRHCAVVHGPADEAIDGVDHRLADGAVAAIPELGLTMRTISVPGHTSGHIALFTDRFGDDPRPVLFSGDTLFAAGCGRVFEGTADQMFDSLSRLSALPADTLVHCAHEYTLSNLRFAAAVEPDSSAVADRLAEARRRRETGGATVPSVLADELATNPFLRSNHPAPRAAAAARLGHAPRSGPECFAALRDWKNVFR